MTSVLLLLLVSNAAASPPPARARAISVLVLPFEAKGGAPKDFADVLTQLFVSAAGNLRGYKIVAFQEVQHTMSQEQLRMVAGCDTASCAAEIAGALATDQIVIGSITQVGSRYILSLSRIRARDAVVVERAVKQFKGLSQETVVDGLPPLVDALFALQKDQFVETLSDAPPAGQGTQVASRDGGWLERAKPPTNPFDLLGKWWFRLLIPSLCLGGCAVVVCAPSLGFYGYATLVWNAILSNRLSLYDMQVFTAYFYMACGVGLLLNVLAGICVAASVGGGLASVVLWIIGVVRPVPPDLETEES